MMKISQFVDMGRFCVVLAALILPSGCTDPSPRTLPEARTKVAKKEYTREDALRMIQGIMGTKLYLEPRLCLG